MNKKIPGEIAMTNWLRFNNHAFQKSNKKKSSLKRENFQRHLSTSHKHIKKLLNISEKKFSLPLNLLGKRQIFKHDNDDIRLP